MKKLKQSLWAKITAILLFCVFGAGVAASAVAVILLESWGAYTNDYETARENALSELAWNRLYSSYNMYCNGVDPEEIYPDSNFRFGIYDADGKLIYTNKKALGEMQITVSTTMEPSYHVESSEETAGGQEVVLTVYNRFTGERVKLKSGEEFDRWREENTYNVRGYVLKEFTVQDEFSQRLDALDALYPYRMAFIGAAAGCLVLMLLLLVFLMSTAGHRVGTDEIRLGCVDRVPLDVFLFCVAMAEFMPMTIGIDTGLPGNIVGYSIFGALILGMVLVFLLFAMSMAVRIKSGTLWKNCLCLRFVRWCWRLLKSLLGFALELLRAVPMNRRWVMIVAAFVLAESFLIVVSRVDEGMLLLQWALNLLLCAGFILYCIHCFQKLRLGAKELASGSLTCSIDTKYMRGEFLEHAEDLMHIRSGLNAAVAERMKSERFQSELITNVSHDIKTPLTSIVNYVDLLEKEELDNETAKEYVQVLSRQSAKLKKLIGDLIEASKASAGVLAVKPEPCELDVLMDQCAGEYGERLENAMLSLVLTKPDHPVKIMADGRHMWRIFDNLMNNVLKYAMPGTRVYLSLARENGKALMSFRNISRDALNISGEELMGRFVRGDSSRSTEGSGLGLAIARSLCQLQGGEMELSVDGDLFKVVLKFDEIV